MAGSCKELVSRQRVAVIGGGLAGLMAARALSRQGAQVTVYEARAQVGGRVLSDTTFAKGRIVEAGAELIGSIHTRWCALAKEYGLSLISRMNTDLYAGQQLSPKLTLDRPLTVDEIRAIEEELSVKVLRKIAERAQKINATEPWKNVDPDVLALDRVSVASFLKHFLGVHPKGPTARLWMATEHLLVHNNVALLEDMNMLGLLCLVKGGQEGTISRDPLMGYWDELEIYRCAEGAQRLAVEIAKEVHAAKGCRVVTKLAVTRIALPRSSSAPVLVRATSTRGREVDRRLDRLVSPLGLPYDRVILAVPPSVWDLIEITPTHPKDVIGLMGMGGATKFFSRVNGRFWVKKGAAPYGGSLDLGHVWEGTDNQTRVHGQDIVLSVFAGGPRRLRKSDDYRRELTRLYRDYPDNSKKNETMLVDWEQQSFIKTGYMAPRLGQILTIGRELNEPFPGRLFFAGDHTEMAHFGYMEGAIRSGERAAGRLIKQVCDPPEVRVAGGASLLAAG